MNNNCRTIPAKADPTFRTEKIGVIEVDTGSLVICDPCHLDEIVENGIPSGEYAGLTGKFLNKKGRPFAVRSETGLGDGKFPVFAEIMDDPTFGERVIALHIHLYPEYSLPGDGKEIEEMEKDFLIHMNE